MAITLNGTTGITTPAISSTGASTFTGALALPSGGLTVGTDQLAVDSSGRVTMPYQPAFIAYRNTTVWEGYSNQVVVWTSTDLNVGNHFNTSTGAFTAPIDGLYFFNAQVYQLNTGTQSYVYVRVNGSTNSRTRMSLISENAALDSTNNLTVVQRLNANDTVDVQVSGDLYTGHSRFSGYLIG